MSFTPSPTVVSLDAVQGLREAIADLFQVFDTALDKPEKGYVRFRGRFLVVPDKCFDDLRERFERFNFTPLIKEEEGQILLIGLPAVFQARKSNSLINILLLIATIFSTLYVGANYVALTPEESFMLWRGWPYSLSIMLILGAHEMGHYFAARYHKVPVTLPYFIPLPLVFGTMGAFIRMKEPVKNKRALLDVGAAGPWAGLLFAIPILIYGLATSPVQPLPIDIAYQLEGNSILYAIIKFLIFGRFLPAGGMDVHLNQVAWAGWTGLFVTSLNLIPLGTLDGGHIAFSLLGNWSKRLFWPIILLLIALVIFAGATSWILWIALLFFVGRFYMDPLDAVTDLDPRRKLIAILTLLLFFLLFMPLPLQVIMP